MIALIFGLISYFSWGTGVLFEAIAARKLASYSLAFWSFLLSAIILSLFVPFIFSDLANLTINILILNIIIAIVGLFLGLITYYEALKIGNPALVGTIAQSFPAVVVVLSILFLGEKLSLNQAAAITVIFVGLILSTLDLKQIKNKNSFINKGSLMAVVTMLSWGIYFTFIKIPVQKVGWFWPNYISFLIFPILYLFIRIRKIKLEPPTKNSVFLPLTLSTILVRIAELSYSYGISKGAVSLVAPIAGASPTLFVILAFLVFKDPITKQQFLGIVTTLVGIVLLSFFSI